MQGPAPAVPGSAIPAPRASPGVEFLYFLPAPPPGCPRQPSRARRAGGMHRHPRAMGTGAEPPSSPLSTSAAPGWVLRWHLGPSHPGSTELAAPGAAAVPWSWAGPPRRGCCAVLGQPGLPWAPRAFLSSSAGPRRCFPAAQGPPGAAPRSPRAPCTPLPTGGPARAPRCAELSGHTDNLLLFSTNNLLH